MITNMQLSDGSWYQIGDIESVHSDDGQYVIRYKNGIQISMVGSNIALGGASCYKINLVRPFVEDTFVWCVVSANNSKASDESNIVESTTHLNSYLQIGYFNMELFICLSSVVTKCSYYRYSSWIPRNFIWPMEMSAHYRTLREEIL